ncbi:hypothetical protein HPB49_008597 [Dermacentor silvarum]|uniref:Uncharacterized protein n=1 Tax=Dermacentor silvarum TaxID=543639 RepID=A0ACB8DNK1_DERSI|nr:hypothetical protein HPB49_008597 [Dermacentor silvarum]
MAGDDSQTRNSRNNSAKITILQWNCRAFKPRTKRAALRLHLTTHPDMPTVVALQEPGDDATLTNFKVYQRDAQIAICVHQNLTATPVDLAGNTGLLNLVTAFGKTEQKGQLSEATPAAENCLLHLWEARHSLIRRWRQQKHNRQLKLRIAELTQKAGEYAAQLADSNCADRRNTAAKQMSNRST